MAEQSLKNIFTHHGSYHHKGAVESGTTIIVKNGDCTIEGPIGDDVCIEAEGDVFLLVEAGNNLSVKANGSFQGKTLGLSCNVKVEGQAIVENLGRGSVLHGKKGSAVTKFVGFCQM